MMPSAFWQWLKGFVAVRLKCCVVLYDVVEGLENKNVEMLEIADQYIRLIPNV